MRQTVSFFKVKGLTVKTPSMHALRRLICGTAAALALTPALTIAQAYPVM